MAPGGKDGIDFGGKAVSGVVKIAPGDQEGAEWLRWRRVARMALISRKVSSD